jgi:hypothetical protein
VAEVELLDDRGLDEHGDERPHARGVHRRAAAGVARARIERAAAAMKSPASPSGPRSTA